MYMYLFHFGLFIFVRKRRFFEKAKKFIGGKGILLSGRFELVGEDGTIVSPASDEDKSLYYAVAKAAHPDLSKDEVNDKVQFLRWEVGDEVK